MRRIVMTVILALWVGASPGVGAAPFVTEGRPQLVALAPGVTIVPILTTGDVVRGGRGPFQFTGIPDGIGVVRTGAETIDLLVNHELTARIGNVADSRIDRLRLSATGQVLRARYVLDGTEGYEGLCASTVATVDGVTWYLTGEERPGTSQGGLAIAVDTATDRVHELPWFGAFNHENVVPVSDLTESVVFLPEDPWATRAQAYAFFSGSLGDALRGDGKLAAFVPLDPGDGDPSANDLAVGEPIRGRFVPIPEAEAYDGRELDALTRSMGAFSFVRIEDAVIDPGAPGTVYFADTGSFAATSEVKNGRIYRFSFDPGNPRRALLEVILDGDTGDRIVNPDNLAIAGTTLMIQENHNDEDSRAARVWAYDLVTRSLTAVAKTDPTVGAVTRGGGRGVWESSGIVDASRFFGEGTWLLDVQAHRTKVGQQGLDLRIDSADGTGGQLLLMTVPGT